MRQLISRVSEIRDSKGNGDKGKKLLHTNKNQMHTQQCHCATQTCGIRAKAPLWSVDVNVDKCHRQKILSLREYAS